MTATHFAPDTAITAAVEKTTAAARRLALEGARDITPMVIGVIPFALAIGASIGASSLTRSEGLASGPMILAGAAQLGAVEMLDQGAAPLVIILSAIMINARIILYSASLAPWFTDQPLHRRLLLAVPVIDQLHFTCSPRFARGDLDSRDRLAYYVGAAGWLLTAWVVTQASAILIGAQLPAALGLDVAAPLALVGLIAKSTNDRASIVAAMSSMVMAVVAVGLPLHSSILIATLFGITAGRVADVIRPRDESEGGS
jgi:predicted branched-subunit amino acid permease